MLFAIDQVIAASLIVGSLGVAAGMTIANAITAAKQPRYRRGR